MRVRFWFEMLAAGSAIACAVALLIATLGAVTGSVREEAESPQAAQSPAPAKTYEGVITDTHCGAKHSAAIAETAADCTRRCIHAGERFALVDGDKMYVLAGEAAALKKAAGERVKVVGTLTGNTILVVSVAAPAP